MDNSIILYELCNLEMIISICKPFLFFLQFFNVGIEVLLTLLLQNSFFDIKYWQNKQLVSVDMQKSDGVYLC